MKKVSKVPFGVSMKHLCILLVVFISTFSFGNCVQDMSGLVGRGQSETLRNFPLTPQASTLRKELLLWGEKKSLEKHGEIEVSQIWNEILELSNASNPKKIEEAAKEMGLGVPELVSQLRGVEKFNRDPKALEKLALFLGPISEKRMAHRKAAEQQDATLAHTAGQIKAGRSLLLGLAIPFLSGIIPYFGHGTIYDFLLAHQAAGTAWSLGTNLLGFALTGTALLHANHWSQYLEVLKTRPDILRSPIAPYPNLLYSEDGSAF